MKKSWGYIAATLLLSCFCSCGGSSETQVLTFNFSEVTPSVSKGLQKAVDPSSWTVKCTSRNSADNKTTLTGTYSAGQFQVSGVPQSQDTLCYLLDGGAAVKATISVSDTNSIGSKRDTFYLGSAATASLAYDESSNSAVATAAAGSSLPAPSTFDDEDLTYTYSINCNNYPKAFSVINDDQSNYDCPAEINNVTVLMHRISSTDSAGAIHYNYGVWAGENVYKACGYTEGLESAQLPTGWTITSESARATAAYTWTSPFQNLTASSTSAAIMAMIQSTTTSDGASKSYATYAIENAGAEKCSSVSLCAENYYFDILRPEAQAGNLEVCWPELELSFDEATVTFAPKAGDGSSMLPVGKHAFMESYTNGSDLYMRDVQTHSAYVPGDSEAVACSVTSTMLVSIVAPGGDPGNQKVGKFNNTQSVKAVSGVAADTERCSTHLGGDNEWTPNGYYSKADMIKVNPIPTP